MDPQEAINLNLNRLHLKRNIVNASALGGLAISMAKCWWYGRLICLGSAAYGRVEAESRPNQPDKGPEYNPAGGPPWAGRGRR